MRIGLALGAHSGTLAPRAKGGARGDRWCGARDRRRRGECGGPRCGVRGSPRRGARGRRTGDVLGKRGHGVMRWGVDLFVEDAAYTTVTSAAAILVVLALLFSSASVLWTSLRSADVQVSADATALAGANVVASYHTAATVADASVLSLGLAGFVMTGGGLVATLVPGAQGQAARMVDTGIEMIRMRNELAASASRGLQTLEGSLPYLIAANGTRACSAQTSGSLSYAGTALAAPMTSASEFPLLDGEGIEVSGLEEASDELEGAASELSEASREAAAKKEAAWLADCGAAGFNMQERADRLSGLSPSENPDFASSLTWEPNVALDRARAYYRWRLEHEAPQATSVEARADSAARRAFYEYAVELLKDARVEERDGRVVCAFELLPKNTDEVRQTALYSKVMWPSSVDGGLRTLHFGAECPGAHGQLGPLVSFADMEAGSVGECPVCKFGVGDVGKTPAASTSIDNGFEYHLRACMLALREYAPARQRVLDAERAARGEAADARDAFAQAVEGLHGVRPRIAPPGRFGCIAVVAARGSDGPEQLDSSFAGTARVPERGAVSAAVLAPAPATEESNVLASFFSSLEERVGEDGPVGIVDGVMDLWGKMLMAYGEAGAGFEDAFSEVTQRLDGMGVGPIASWLKDGLARAIEALGIEPVDMRLRKPVLTDTSVVAQKAGMADAVALQARIRDIPMGSSDPREYVRALGYELEEYVMSLECTLMEIPLPTGGSIPVTIRLRDVADWVSGEGS